MPRAIVVGAGHAGSQCAISLRKEGYEGDIVLIDNDAAPYPYHKPPLSKKFIDDEAKEAVALRAASAYTKADVEQLQQSVSSIDTASQSVTVSDGSSLSYDHLVLATGARNRTLADVASLGNVHSLRTLEDAIALRTSLSGARQLVVLGGGFIGLEIAACLALKGINVSVLEAADRVLSRVVTPAVSSHVEQYLSSINVDVLTGTLAGDFETADGSVRAIGLPNSQSLACDALVVGIGAIPDTSLAEAAGIECDNGIMVNDSLQSSAANVYAIGDCASYPHWQTVRRERLESVQNAVEQAKVVAASIAGGEPKTYRNVPWFWSDIGALKLQIAGIHQGDTKTVVRTEGGQLAVYHLVDDVVVCVESVDSGKDHLLARKLIDGQLRVAEENILSGPEALKAIHFS